MPEEDHSTLHDERFVAVGNLVVRAANQAWTDLKLLQDQIINSSIGGHASLKELEERKARLLSDATILGSMAVKFNPEYVLGGEKDESPSPDNTNGNVERIRHNGIKNKVVFEQRASAFVHFMAEQGGTVEQKGGVSAGKLVGEGLEMDSATWGNFSGRLRDLGILEYERERPYSKKISRASMNKERVAELIEAGDLPQELTEALEGMDAPTGENVEVPDVDVGDYDSLTEEYSTLVKADINKRLRDDLSSIHTRNTGASLHQRANSR